VWQCLQLIEPSIDVVSKTNQYKDVFKDNSLNEANVRFANLIASQESAFGTFVTLTPKRSAQLAALKASKPTRDHRICGCLQPEGEIIQR
jgi:hypothetical protein